MGGEGGRREGGREEGRMEEGGMERRERWEGERTINLHASIPKMLLCVPQSAV